MDKKIFDKIKKGKISIDAMLDLHGMTQDTAISSLKSFVRGMSRKGNRYTIVITGIGSGILKNEFPRWLELSDIKPYVVDFKKADIRHGGDGAFYLIIRKS